MAYDETLASRVREILRAVEGFSEKKMFGGICFLVHGNMCCGVLKQDLVLRIDPEYGADVLNRAHARPMDFTGRPMKGFVLVAPGALASAQELRGWVSLALSFARKLPPKAPGKSVARSATTRPRKRPPAP
jgi:TfoX/Sxy family transcriptional regulator of competence genes